MPAQTAPHVWIDAEGHAWIDDSGIKVVEIAAAHDMGFDVENIQNQLYWMTREQIDAALTYYLSHKEVFDRVIADFDRRIKALHEELGESLLQERLRRLKHGQ